MAKLLDGTRIYGTANVDTRVNVGANVFANTSALSIGPFGTTNGTLITTTSVDVGNTTANAALDYNIIYVANSTSRANLTPTALAIGSITVNSALANLQALNVVNQTNTGTLFVTTSANVGTALTVNSTAINAAVNTSIRAIIANGSIGTSGQLLTSNATGIYWSNPTTGSASVTISTTAPVSPSEGDMWWDSEEAQLKIYYNDGTSSQWVDASSTAYGLAGGGNTQIQFSDSGTLNATAGFIFNKVTNNVTVANTLIVGNSTINTTANSTVILVNGVDLVATQKRAIAMSMIFGR